MRAASRPLFALTGLVLVSLLGLVGCAEREKRTEQQSVAPTEPPPVVHPQPVAIPQGIPIKRPMGAMVDPNLPNVDPIVTPRPVAAPPPSASASASK